MPQESQSNEKNSKSKRHFSVRRRSFVDTFRWGFVPEEDGNVAPKSETTKPDTQKSAAPKPAAKKPSPAAPIDVSEPASASASQPKRSRQRKKTAKTAEAKPIIAAQEKPDEGSAPKTPGETGGNASKQPVRGKRPSKRNKGRANIALPPYTAVGYDENDEDLKLPSYGRTPIPADDELPVPQPLVRRSAQPPKTNAPQSDGHVPVAGTDVFSDVSSAGFRHRREQMVWDPDRSEYVPLVIAKEPEPSAPKKPSKRTPALRTETQSLDSAPKTQSKTGGAPSAPAPSKRQERTEKPVERTKTERSPKPHKSLPIPPKEESNRRPEGRTKHSPPVEGEHFLQQNVGVVPPAKTCSKPEHVDEQPPRQRDSRRNRLPKHVDSSKPDPADIEAEVSGFAELGVSETMLEALRMVRYLAPTPIQAGVFQKVQAGVDLMGQARTGTGKTAAFSIPIIEGVETCPPGNNPVALILVPTRELAVQVRDEATRLAYGRDVRITACYGGKPLAKQIERLRNGIDIVVGTPGRIFDLMNRGALSLDSLRWVVLDEADRMLDIGFRPQIEKILKRTPAERQTLLFSATLPAPVVRLAERYMKSPEILDFSDKSVAVETIDQYYVTVDPERKFDALVYLLQEQEPQQAIIFTRTKRGADRLARLLSNKFEKLAAIHGDLQQSERDNVMAKVRAGSVRYLVATDVVGRGIDVTGISHIINYDIPKFCDDYIHRVGRTGRMGRDGIAFTFVTVQEGSELTRIEMRIDKLLKRAELKGFESFTKLHDPSATLDDDDIPEPPKPVFGKPVRKVRRAL